MKTINAITKKGEKLYYRLKSELEEKYHPSDYVTIEIESGRYFVSKTAVEAIEKAEKASPDKQFFLARVSEVAFKWYTLPLVGMEFLDDCILHMDLKRKLISLT